MMKISEGSKSFGVLGQTKTNYNPGKDKAGNAIPVN